MAGLLDFLASLGRGQGGLLGDIGNRPDASWVGGVIDPSMAPDLPYDKMRQSSNVEVYPHQSYGLLEQMFIDPVRQSHQEMMRTMFGGEPNTGVKNNRGADSYGPYDADIEQFVRSLRGHGGKERR